MTIFQKRLAVTAVIVVILLLLAVPAVNYFVPGITQNLFSAAGLSKAQLRKGFVATLSDGRNAATPGQVVTYTFTFKNNMADSAFSKMSPVFGVDVTGLKVQNISDGGRVNSEQVIVWEPQEMGYGQTVKRTFQLVVPKTPGSKYCLNAAVGAMLVLPIGIAEANDCTTIVAKIVPEATIKSIFQQVFGRTIKSSELTYWNLRAQTDKTTEPLLKEAMGFYKQQGRTVGK